MPVVHENEPAFRVGPLVNLTEIIQDLGFDPGLLYAEFGYTPETFANPNRRLRAAGTSFRNELDLARQALSEELLNSARLQVSDVANALGYANASGFIRAFVRWKGITPNRFREQSRNGGDAKCIN